MTYNQPVTRADLDELAREMDKMSQRELNRLSYKSLQEWRDLTAEYHRQLRAAGVEPATSLWPAETSLNTYDGRGFVRHTIP